MTEPTNETNYIDMYEDYERICVKNMLETQE